MIQTVNISFAPNRQLCFTLHTITNKTFANHEETRGKYESSHVILITPSVCKHVYNGQNRRN
jgi:hypothetical protein